MPLEFKMKSIQIFWQNYITCKQGKTVTQKSQDNQPWWWESQEYIAISMYYRYKL